MPEVQITLDDVNSKLETIREKISEINDIAIETLQNEIQKSKRQKKYKVLVNCRTKLSGIYIYIYISHQSHQ